MNFSMHDDVEPLESICTATDTRSSGFARNACGVCTRTNLPLPLVDSKPPGPCSTTSGMVNAGIAPPNSRATESAVTNMSRPASGRAASWINTTSTAPDSMSSAR
jgi:hypothetical protein